MTRTIAIIDLDALPHARATGLIQSALQSGIRTLVFKGSANPVMTKNVAILREAGCEIDLVEHSWQPGAGDEVFAQAETGKSPDKARASAGAMLPTARRETMLNVRFDRAVHNRDALPRLYLLEDGTIEKGILTSVDGDHCVQAIAFPNLQYKVIPWKNVIGWTFDGPELLGTKQAHD